MEGISSALIPVVVPIVVRLIRGLRIPRLLLPVVAVILGALGDYLLGLAGGATVGPIWGGLLGAGGVVLRDIYKEIMPKT